MIDSQDFHNLNREINTKMAVMENMFFTHYFQKKTTTPFIEIACRKVTNLHFNEVVGVHTQPVMYV